MQNLLARFTKIQKIIIGIALLVIAGALTFFVATKGDSEAKNFNNNQNINSNVPVVINTSDWNTYNEPRLAIEFKYPSNWDSETIGVSDKDDRFWHENVLTRSFWSGGQPTSTFNLTLTVKKSSLSLDDFWVSGTGISLTGKQDHKIVASFPAIIDNNALYEVKNTNRNLAWQSGKKVLIKNGDVFYFFDFVGAGSNFQEMQNIINNLETVFTTIQISQSAK